MAAAGHPPSTLPPPSTQHFHQAHSPFGATPEPFGEPHASEPRFHYGNHTGSPGPAARAGLHYPPPPPPPYNNNAPYNSRQRAGGSFPGEDSTRVPTPTTVYVAPPKIEMQPWARTLWRWLVDNSTGVARVDLRRPTLSLPEQYDGNLLVVRSRQSVATQRDWGSKKQPGGSRGEAAVPAYASYGPHYAPPYPGASPAAVSLGAAVQPPGQPLLMGARIKITRRFIVGGGGGGGHSGDEADSIDADAVAGEAAAAQPPPPPPPPSPSWQRRRGPSRSRPVRASPLARSWAEKPLLDFGVGVNLDVDQQQIQPVARIKIKDLLSIKLAPLGLLKVSRSIPLGPVALKVRYDLPLSHAKRFWEPPARLMVRLDNAAGSGVHLTPGGLDFEEVFQFGSAVSLRTSASLLFPRQLPLEEGEPPFRMRLHRLSLKSIW